MRLVLYVGDWLLVISVGLSSLSYGQKGDSIVCPTNTEQPMFSVFCDPAQPAMPDFLHLTQNRVLGPNVLLDPREHLFDRIRQPSPSLDEVSCPKSCHLCGIIHDDEGTPTRVCTKG
jgi:hypothetical protein